MNEDNTNVSLDMATPGTSVLGSRLSAQDVYSSIIVGWLCSITCLSDSPLTLTDSPQDCYFCASLDGRERIYPTQLRRGGLSW